MSLLFSIFGQSLPRTLVSAIGRCEAGREESSEGFRMRRMIASFHNGIELSIEKRYEREFFKHRSVNIVRARKGVSEHYE